MTKSAFIASCYDPFVLLLNVKLWRDRWQNEIDHLYINLNNHCGVPKEVEVETIKNLVGFSNISLVYHSRGIGNGVPLVELTKICKEDLVLLLEDDFFIHKPDVVKGNFQRIESGECDLLGSPRYGTGEIAEAAKKKFNLDYSGYGDKGFGLWPTGLYCRKEDLLRTSLDFGSNEYKAGTYCPELDHTFIHDCYTDTFTWASIQLRSLGLKIGEIAQNHASPFEIEEFDKKEGKWANGNPPYIHGGSLSSGWGGYLSGKLPDVSTDIAKQEIETRVAFWLIASAVVDGFTDFKYVYQQGIERLINNCQLDRDRIGKKVGIYRALLQI